MKVKLPVGVLNQYTAHQQVNRENKPVVVDHLVKWPTPKTKELQNDENVGKYEKRACENDDLGEYPSPGEYYDENDVQSDDIFLNDDDEERASQTELSTNEQLKTLPKAKTHDDEELEKQIWHEIYMLDKTLAEYS